MTKVQQAFQTCRVNEAAKAERTDEGRAELGRWLKFGFQIGEIGRIDDRHAQSFKNDTRPQKADRVEANEEAKQYGAQERD